MRLGRPSAWDTKATPSDDSSGAVRAPHEVQLGQFVVLLCLARNHPTVHLPIHLCNRIRQAIGENRTLALDIPEFLRHWIGICLLGIQGRFEQPTPFDYLTYTARRRFALSNEQLRREAERQQWWMHRHDAPWSNPRRPIGETEDHSLPRRVVDAIDKVLPQVRALCPSRTAFIRQAAEYGLAVCMREGTPVPHPDWRTAH